MFDVWIIDISRGTPLSAKNFDLVPGVSIDYELSKVIPDAVQKTLTGQNTFIYFNSARWIADGNLEIIVDKEYPEANEKEGKTAEFVLLLKKIKNKWDIKVTFKASRDL